MWRTNSNPCFWRCDMWHSVHRKKKQHPINNLFKCFDRSSRITFESKFLYYRAQSDEAHAFVVFKAEIFVRHCVCVFVHWISMSHLNIYQKMHSNYEGIYLELVFNLFNNWKNSPAKLLNHASGNRPGVFFIFYLIGIYFWIRLSPLFSFEVLLEWS